MVLAGWTLGRAASASRRRPSSSLVPSSRTTKGTVGLISPKAAIRPSATSSQRVMPPKMLNRTALTAVLARIRSTACLIVSALDPPPASRKLAGEPAGLGDDVQRRHDEARAVAEDADVAVELDVLDALLLGPALERVFVLAVGERLVLGVAVERVAVERDLRVERLDLALGGHDQRVDLGQGRVLLRARPRRGPRARRRRPRRCPRRPCLRGPPAGPPRARARPAGRCGGGSASRASSRRPLRCPRRPRC